MDHEMTVQGLYSATAPCPRNPSSSCGIDLLRMLRDRARQHQAASRPRLLSGRGNVDQSVVVGGIMTFQSRADVPPYKKVIHV
jgi:hypothetical protein